MNNSDKTERKVKEILSSKLGYPIDKIAVDSSLVNDLGIDSFLSVELMFELDDEFGIKIQMDEFSNFETVRDVINFIHKMMQKRDS